MGEEYGYDGALQELSCKNYAANCSANFTNTYHEYENVLEWSAFPENVIVPVLFGIIFVAGLLGNGIVLLVVARSGLGSKKKVTNLYFGSLALADLCFLVVCVPTTTITYMLPSWPFGPHVCKYLCSVN